MPTGKKLYVGLDLFKLIAALMIMSIHTLFDYGVLTWRYLVILAPMAVPFFVIASGYFFARGLLTATDRRAYIFRYEKRLLILYAAWSVVYLPMAAITYWEQFDGNILMFLFAFVRGFLFSGTYPILWYIPTIMGGAALIYLFVKWNKPALMYACGGLLFVLYVLYSQFGSFFGTLPGFAQLFAAVDFVFSCERNFLLLGFPVMLIGLLLYRHPPKLKAAGAAVCLLVCTFLHSFSTFWLLTQQALFGDVVISSLNIGGLEIVPNQLTLLCIPMAIFAFILGMQLKLPRLAPYSHLMREFSMFLYFSHAFFRYFITLPDWWPVLLVLLCCLTAYALLKLLQWKFHWKPLNWLLGTA